MPSMAKANLKKGFDFSIPATDEMPELKKQAVNFF